MTTALITGITGQDAWYLANHLRGQGTRVFGASRSGNIPIDLPFVHALPPTDVVNAKALVCALEQAAPDEVYHLAAQSSVSASWNDPSETLQATGLGTVNLLEAVRKTCPHARVFLASSSEIFGRPDTSPQSERTSVTPVTPYGAAKAFAFQLGRMYRNKHNLFVSNGILYNHESPRRRPTFVFRKITQGAVKIAQGTESELRLGNLEAVRDWGFAGDYVRAMHLQLQHSQPDDFVIATGEGRSVRDLCKIAFSRVGLDYADHVISDPVYWRQAEPIPLVGDPRKSRELLGWVPEVSFGQLVDIILRADF